ncbi:hypothetical protein L5515_013531 [Caenorhabditis briggsae]|uniref:GPI ethanolamine phosphate transferase 2 C-terminal domain-containing protein n=1 Tax=Caenorhabditis briggsae TaxID=6238 RepID=A0AAE9EAI9_CAEBR|nr:hypothetical protein L5515_013531 [Caenorhabditis briggsae]
MLYFVTSRILVVIACALLVYSFVSLDGKSDAPENHENDKAKTDEKSRKDPRLVFMVIDAFRLSFLTSPDSPMSFTKSSLSSAPNPAILFDAYARMPTVTLPRITAYITGTLPSFGTILTNLATDEIKIDNWISRLSNAGKRIHFFGDDTWIRLLPGKFEKSEGVTSFFVNDYTEVDQNVTRNLDSELLEASESPWDVLILHYLGLDHIGHSLGGNSPKIPEKLKEMDEIVKRIFEFLSSESSQESYLIVCGDHGMTSAGSHGGASPDETRVPVIIWKIGGQKIDNRFTEPPRIEQIDLSATIFDLFNLNFPPESYGISLAHYFRGETQEGLRKRHEHFKALVKEKQLGTSDICESSCDYSDIFVKNSLKKWFRSVQEELIGTASEIPTASIWICVFILAVATILSTASQGNYPNLLILLINLINFASSLIEEEHEVWYFLGSTAVAIRLILCIEKREFAKARLALVLGILHRISFGYMQSTRRRWEMDPNLLPQPFFSDFFDKEEVMDLNEFFKDKAAFAIAIPLLLCADNKQKLLIVTPILARSFEYLGFPSFFHNFIRFSVFPIYYLTDSPLHAVAPWILLLAPVSQLPLCLLAFLIGLCTRILKLGDVESLIFCMSSFFYFGNSNSLSTLSLTSAYIGLQDYYPILVGIQLILYTFAGPIFFFLGRYLLTVKPPPRDRTGLELIFGFIERDPPPFLSPSTSWLRLFFSYRIFSLAISLICLYHFQNHLFVWSVYSPKVVYDMAHVIFSGFVSFYYP